jgi:N-acetylmuramoyl-L-alanine amidase
MTKLVVIDPGHGGHDPGAVENGLQEMQVVLAISERIETALKRGWQVDVLLTRRDKATFLDLAERAQLANSRNAASFVSIHSNAAQAASARGFETHRHAGGRGIAHRRAPASDARCGRAGSSGRDAVTRTLASPGRCVELIGRPRE